MAIWSLFFVFVIALFSIKIGSTPPGVSNAEIDFINQSSSTTQIIENPVNAPMKLPILALKNLDVEKIAAFRLVSAFYGIVSVIVFYFYVRAKQTRRVTMMASILFATSSWMLHTSRLALPIVLLPLGIIMLLYMFKEREQKRKITPLLAGIYLGFLAYIPGLLIVSLPLLILSHLQDRKIDSHRYSRFLNGTVGLALFAAITMPLFLAMFKGTASAYTTLGIPAVFEPVEWLRQLVSIPVYLFARGPLQPAQNLAQLPLLDVFSSILVILGLYAFFAKIKDKSTSRLVAVGISTIILASINDLVMLPILLPVFFVFIASGLALLLQQWFTVFPNNPLARNIGVIIVIISVSIISGYHIRRYFVAWDKSPATHAEFNNSEYL